MNRVGTAYISVGSNIGDRLAHCRSAVAWLAAGGMRISAHSRYFDTRAVGYADQPSFINAVFALQTALKPPALLGRLQLVQRLHGRKNTGIRFGPRVLDLDILFYNDMIIDDAGLVVPHPRLSERRFVLEPLCDIAPDFLHPGMGVAVKTLLERLPVDDGACIPVDAALPVGPPETAASPWGAED